ncbi:hypothetical protein [Nonomuraea sp. NPDC050786]|uniref:hypothetical protein n=1 Tax=Nonomuraea sp. NPDC050786 TaxID=3154840 RepID=UPI0033D7A6EF
MARLIHFPCRRRGALLMSVLLAALSVMFGLDATVAMADTAPRLPVLVVHGYSDTCFGMNATAKQFGQAGDTSISAYLRSHGFPDVRNVGYYDPAAGMNFAYDDGTGGPYAYDEVSSGHCDVNVTDETKWSGPGKCKGTGTPGFGMSDPLEHIACLFAWYVHDVNVGDANHAGTAVDVVAHSMGGLVVRAAEYFSSFPADTHFTFPPPIYIRRVVTVATPHDGLQGAVAYFYNKPKFQDQEVMDMTVCKGYADTCTVTAANVGANQNDPDNKPENLRTSWIMKKLHTVTYKPGGADGRTFWALIGASVACDSWLDGRMANTCWVTDPAGPYHPFTGTDFVVQSDSMLAMPADVKIMYGKVEHFDEGAQKIIAYDSGGPAYTHEANTCFNPGLGWPMPEKVCATAPFYLNDARSGSTKAFACTASCNGNTGDAGMNDVKYTGSAVTEPYSLAQIAALLPPPPAYDTTALVLRSDYSKSYVSAELGSDYTGKTPDRLGMLRARAASPGSWEAWTEVFLSSGHIALRNNASGKYVSVELNYPGADQNELRARSDTIGPWETFDLVWNSDHTYSLWSVAVRKYVSAEMSYTGYNQYELRARADSIGPWERFLNDNAGGASGCFQYACDNLDPTQSFSTQNRAACNAGAYHRFRRHRTGRRRHAGAPLGSQLPGQLGALHPIRQRPDLLSMGRTSGSRLQRARV